LEKRGPQPATPLRLRTATLSAALGQNDTTLIDANDQTLSADSN